MVSYSEYYEKRLYPLQDGVLNCVAGCKTEFFLTGGTAINRGLHNRRYSDDLDFFLSASVTFASQGEAVIGALDKSGYKIDNSADALKTADFCTFAVYSETNPGEKLKLDFVNDIAAHFGGFIATRLFPRIDSPRNMISNKLTALFRFEAKDVADIHTLCSRSAAEGIRSGSCDGSGNSQRYAQGGFPLDSMDRETFVGGIPTGS